jgi:starvation-inducible DNA-binding protein
MATDTQFLFLENAQMTGADVAGVLANTLADTYMLGTKVHKFIWNARIDLAADNGIDGAELNRHFSEMRLEMVGSLETLAWRIRDLGFPVPGSFRHFAWLSVIVDDIDVPRPFLMVRELIKDNSTLAKRARDGLLVAERANDPTTRDLLSERMARHVRNADCLERLLQNSPASVQKLDLQKQAGKTA